MTRWRSLLYFIASRISPAHLLLALKYAAEALQVAEPLGASPRLNACHALSRAKTAAGQAAEGLELALEAGTLAEGLGFTDMQIRCSYAWALAAAEVDHKDLPPVLAKVTARAEEHRIVLEVHKFGLEAARAARNPTAARRHEVWFTEHGFQNGINRARRYFPKDAPLPGTTVELSVLGPFGVRVAG